MYTWVCIFVKVCIALTYALKNLRTNTSTQASVLYTGVPARTNLLLLLHWQTGVRTRVGPWPNSLFPQYVCWEICVVFTVSPTKRERWRVETNKCCSMTLWCLWFLLPSQTPVVAKGKSRSWGTGNGLQATRIALKILFWCIVFSLFLSCSLMLYYPSLISHIQLLWSHMHIFWK